MILIILGFRVHCETPVIRKKNYYYYYINIKIKKKHSSFQLFELNLVKSNDKIIKISLLIIFNYFIILKYF